MPRKTKAELQAEEAAAKLAAWEKFCESYSERVVNLVYQFGKLGEAGFTVKKVDRETYSFYTDYGWAPSDELLLKVTVPQNPCHDTRWTVDSLESAVADFVAEEEEKIHQREAKKAALAKLSAEERALLGL